MNTPRGRPSGDAEARFRDLYVTTYDDIVRFAQRRIDPGYAEDLAAETMLVAWRRLEQLPRTRGDSRAWLLGIARNLPLPRTPCPARPHRPPPRSGRDTPGHNPTEPHMNETILRTLDPADDPTTELSDRARADLEWILATDAKPTAVPLRRTPRVRLATALTAAAAIAVTGIVAPSFLRSGDTALASWSPAASNLSATESARAGESCRESIYDDDRAADADAVVADRRGDWTTVMLMGDGGFSALCITDASAGWFRKDMIGSSGVATGLRPLGAPGVVATDLGTGTMSAGDISLAAGFAGPEVVGITLDTESHGVVTATVNGGGFALWFPGDELRDHDTVPVDVTYVDGSTATVELEL